MKRLCSLTVAAALSAAACGTEASDPVDTAYALDGEDGDDGEVDAPPRLHARAGAQAPAAARQPDSAPPTEVLHLERSRRAMPGAREAFDEVVALVQGQYVDGPLSEDELWTAAMEGVMARLLRHHGREVNMLMRPEDLSELRIGTEGKLVGIGVRIEIVADVIVIRGVLPGSPAESAGLQAGDRILGVDGERLRGKSLMEVVSLIRGQQDSPVGLFVQRDTEEWDVPLTRSALAYSNVESRMLTEEVGYLRIGGFSTETATDVDTALAALSEGGMGKLVLDLRGCPGGLLGVALEVADRFLAPGKLLVTVRVPGEPDDDRLTETDDAWESLPMVVVTDGQTASSAEIVAGALSHHGRARIVGQTTFGKDTVESIHELSEGWGLKLSVGRFESPGGATAGIRPDLSISSEGVHVKAEIDEVDVDLDEPLRGALELLTGP